MTAPAPGTDARLAGPRAEDGRAPPGRWWPALACGASVAVFAALKAYGFGYMLGDEGIYMYLAARVAEGTVPYLQFFHAHPPLHLLPGALLFKAVGGFDLGVAKSLPIVASGITGILLYRAARRLGAVEGVLACALFLLSFDVLVLSSYYIGANLASLWIAFGLERLSARRPAQAGVAAALGACTLQTAGPPAAGIGLALLLFDWRLAIRFGVAAAIAFALVNGVAVALLGRAYVYQVYVYHLIKAPGSHDALATWVRILELDGLLMFAGLAGLVALALRAASRRARGGDPLPARPLGDAAPLLVACAGGALGSLASVAALDRPARYYFLALFVCLAPLAGFGLAEVGRSARDALRGRSVGRALRGGALAGVIVLGMLGAELWRPGGRAPAVHFEWRGSSIPALDAIVRPLLWRDSLRWDEPVNPWTRYLVGSSGAVFDGAEPLAAQVRELTAPDATVFGDSESAPLIALLAERRIWRDEADTNFMRYRGQPDALQDLLSRLEADPPDLLIGRERYGIFDFAPFVAWVNDNYQVVFHYQSPVLGTTHLLFLRRDRAG